MNLFDNSYKSLQSLKEYNKPYSISKIEWWLMKYYELYRESVKNNQQYCEKCMEYINNKLPTDCLLNPGYCVKSEEATKFIRLYDTLDEVTQIHRLSQQCFAGYDEYSFLVCVEEDYRHWTINYYDLWEKLHYFFCIYYQEDETKHLSITNIPSSDFEISIERDDFRIIIAFYEGYNKAFYEEGLYPEKRLEIEQKMNTQNEQ